ncbi:Retrovirus-related Pol polyprotein like [Argiope bruennichi]|uniref:RNA-directed DNA polymerase n=1 Tax=Argiope bruennichi TaxID=94029 RepID=A0A8T0F6R0_ARGBR|nr:Retrovirus-related Pol polyprotein like [Argiope bruennichi]
MVVNFEVEGTVISTKLIVLPEAKGNRTLLGTDILQSAVIVLDVPNGKWHFSEKPQIQYSIYKVPSNTDSCLVADSKEKIAETSSSIQVPKTSSTINLRSDEVPTNVKEVQSFLRSCSWYRRYVPNLANIARPLSNLTKKNVQWIWGLEQQETFETLKKRLITPPVLKQPNGSKPFRIRTDASSSYALGAVLTQGEDPEEHVIEYASRLRTPVEQNCSTTEKEALTVIQSFNPKIEYTSGKSSVLADMLSRLTNLNEDDPCDVFALSADFPVRRPRDIREEQLKDEELKKIIDCFENSSKDENFANWTSQGYLMNQGILYRYSLDVETEEAQLVVPVQERERVWQEYHEVPTTVHFGAEGTYNKVACSSLFAIGRELTTTDDATHDLALIDNDNFVAEITPYLKRFARLTTEIKDHAEQKQDKRKAYYDHRRRQVFYKPGDLVWVTLHPVSKSQNKKSRKFMPKREGPYLVVTNRSPTTYDITDPAKPDEVLWTYHSSALRAYELPVARDSGIVAPLRRRGRPKKFHADSSPRRRASQRGSL